MLLREGTAADDTQLADMFRRMWLDNGVADASIVTDADERVRRFVKNARAEHGLRVFFAVDDGTDVGCAACQRFAGLYPDILCSDLRSYGYVWGVYVAPTARRRGVGEALTTRCVEALRELGCTHVLLHAAPMGERVYRRLGFESTNELRLALQSDPADPIETPSRRR